MRKFWILAAAGRARKRRDRRSRAKCLHKQRRRRELRKNSRRARKKLLGRRRAGVLLCCRVLRQRANRLQGRRKSLCNLQRRLRRRERGELLRGVGVLSKGRRRSAESFELSGERLKKACDLGSKRACNILELAK